ncbi:TetR/AcrR family transcriptional regulator [Nocardia sp. CDC153]|uniref:TetR/AcrR family transcriptional regulator n=1 Tax=Nocardia sp. CDC153 TaxID=3112167 RepID=UPI002DBC340C|nr:TetR/AcrR family transcriptional regulator [Nocardia sp. CDC153]MEC3953737.1 TetR/AcrR family transcriptional regulator [Nocardia sp. CDC153]
MPTARTGTTKRRYPKRLSPADRREQLLDTALRIVANSGFGEVSIASVAERGGVSRPVVYDSFGSREELLDELIRREAARMAEGVGRATAGLADPAAEPAAALRAGLELFLVEVRAMPDTWRLVYFPIDGVPPALRDRVATARDELRAPLRRAFGEWLVRHPAAADGVDLEVLIRIVQGLIQTGARLLLDDPDRFDIPRIVSLLDYLLADES